MVISDYVVMNRARLVHNGTPLPSLQPGATPEQVYEALQCSYPRFFKMDKLCKWAFAGAACLLGNDDSRAAGISRDKTAVVLATSHGCLDVDKRYYNSIDIPSPALFVYTLPNIMLGEICIRYDIKGEQLCMISEGVDAGELFFAVQQQICGHGMTACLCGWVDVSDDEYDIALFLVREAGNGINFTPAAMSALYSNAYGQ